MSKPVFTKAQRSESHLFLAIVGIGGSGKTGSALRLADGMCPGCKIFVVDTEHGAARLETGKPNIPEFFHCTVEQPYTPERYLEACKAAVDQGAEVLIIDSLTHVWSNTGGFLEQKDLLTAESKGKMDSWSAWRVITPAVNRFLEALEALPVNKIVTLRSKTAWESAYDEKKGKFVPQRIGTKPDFREDVDYRFTAVLTLNRENHTAECDKDRTGIFEGKTEIPMTAETGAAIRDWLNENTELAKQASENALHLAIAEMANADNPIQWFETNLQRLKQTVTYHWNELVAEIEAKKQAVSADCFSRAVAEASLFSTEKELLS